MDRLTAPDISWGPSRAVFLRRVAITGGATFVALAIVGLIFCYAFALPVSWVFLVALTLTAGFVLEDAFRWRSARSDRWQMSEGYLIHEGPDGIAQVPLSEIVDVKTQFGSRVIVKLRSGQQMAIRYLPFPKATADQIAAARGPDRGSA
ncbi:hypothetical protein Z946_972 [Sulfitobacter noctilucicola]|uniref:PH domain-containing protein n=1 Tax=Sulfitobacter noctilucicola TaxID=1342301 RepID=A0A7W6Q3R2_9RHOB|nr:hypothetical protein [Sulfitobacter noctilucicola]KIN62116.1 hypothetical protein Z946_972 [Sulfitobacter noctilucicola]MBB4173364.1 hypothetical protein [Sulfitobacter noctilucicola]